MSISYEGIGEWCAPYHMTAVPERYRAEESPRSSEGP